MESLYEIWWISALVVVSLLVIYVILNKFYWLKSWFKMGYFTLIGACVLWTLAVVYNQNKQQSLGTLFDDVSKTEIASNKKAEEVEEMPPPTPEEVLYVQAFQEDMEQILLDEVNPIREEMDKTIKYLKRKGKSTFTQDSLLIRVKAFAQMVEHRQLFVKSKLTEFEQGKLDKKELQGEITRFREDVDSLKNHFNIGENLIERYGKKAMIAQLQ